MPLFSASELAPLGMGILRAAGATDEEARIVLDHCISSHLSGESNHGLEQVVWYTDAIKKGLLKPATPYTIERETDTTLLVNGNFNFGHYVSHHVMARLLDKAETSNVAAASIKYQGHVGRLIDYTSMAARRGFIAMMMCDGAWGRKRVAPTGGKSPRLGVNPWSMTVPSATGGGVVGFDMTSGSVSGTKLWRAQATGQDVPLGWVQDADGRPTTDAHAIEHGGAMLPMGGVGGSHKGYVLSFMIEALANVLCGMEFRENLSKGDVVIDGCFMAVFKVTAFRAIEDWKSDLNGLIEYVKSSEPAADSDGVFYPGERSYLATVERAESGVEIADDVWQRILECADDWGVRELAPEPIG
jgi:LDH2 family malate/lactate/ureidoglycolate dehydrogenase